jgi:CRISPR/Cas system-associated endonuclease Cas3-HD
VNRYDEAWRAARPYMRARKNDVHVPLSFWYAERLLEHHPEADADVVLLAIMFHDAGWAVIDDERIYQEGFATGEQEVDLASDVRILHEKEGARLAAQALGGLTEDPAVVEEVVAIIDGHDSRLEALSRNDELVKDADKLWRYSLTGVSVGCDWFSMTPGQYAARLERQVREALFTDAAREIGARELAHTKAILQTATLT